MDRVGVQERNTEVEIVLHFTKRVDMAVAQTFFRREGNSCDILERRQEHTGRPHPRPGQLNEFRGEVGECVARQREIVVWKT